MKFLKIKNPYPAGDAVVYYPIEGVTNYRCVTIATPHKETVNIESEGTEAPTEPIKEPNLEARFFFFEFFQGQEHTQKVPIQHIGKKAGPSQKVFPVEKIVTTTNYLGAPITDQNSLSMMEQYLEANCV